MNRIINLTNFTLLSQNTFHFATKNLKLIKIRMRTVGSIKKITKAMKMVAASKMRQDVSRLQKAKLFGVGSIDKILQNETYVSKKITNTPPKKTLIVPFTTDKGLCGGTNSSIIRQVKVMVNADRGAFKLFVVGDKGSVALSRPMPDLLEYSVTHLNTPMNFPTAASIASQVLDKAKDCQKIILIFNQFKNAISQVQRKVQLMNKKQFLQSFKYVVRHDAEQPDMSHAAHFFFEFYIATAFYNALLNNIASETSSRMNAMENASKNAGEILDKLTLQYNKARQSKITMELCEIISGASAV